MKKIRNIFLRWGNLNPQKHKEARIKEDFKSYHTAPKYKGIYAFPEGFIEYFLLGITSVGKLGKDRVIWIKDSLGNRITYNEFINNKCLSKTILKKYKAKTRDISCAFDDTDQYIYVKPRPHKFKYNGLLWCHLGYLLKPDEILDSSGSWVKTSTKSYLKALQKYNIKQRFDLYIQQPKEKRHGNPHTFPGYKMKDELEVFIEKIK